MASKKPKEGPFPKNYWERPIPGMTGDADPTAIYAAVGRALSTWEILEERLATLCVVFAEIRDGKGNIAFRQLFGSIESSSLRRNAIVKAGDVYFWPHDTDKKMIGELRQLMRHVSHAATLRDDIAHGIVTNFTSADAKTGETVSIGCFLVPSKYNAGRNKAVVDLSTPIEWKDGEYPFDYLPGDYRYTSENIIDILTRFEKLSGVILNHMAEFLEWKKKVTSPLGSPSAK